MTHIIPIDISKSPDLIRLAEEVAATRTPRKLIRGRKTVAILMPVAKSANISTDYDPKRVVETLNKVAGSWADIDTDALIKHIYKARRRGSRSAFKP